MLRHVHAYCGLRGLRRPNSKNIPSEGRVATAHKKKWGQYLDKMFQLSLLIDCKEVTTRKMTLWGNEFKDKVPRLKFENILYDEEVQFDWLNSLYQYGIALVTDTPVQEGQLEKLGELVGYLRMTAYG